MKISSSSLGARNTKKFYKITLLKKVYEEVPENV
jgi:hypothetical protein